MAGEDGWSVIVPEATTNLITNPSFETGSTGWTLTDADASVTEGRSTEQQFAGAYSYKMVQTDAGDSDYISTTVSCSGSTAYTFSFWSYTSVFTAQAASNRYLYINGGTTTTTVAHTTTTGAWERYSTSITTAGGASTLTLRIYAPQGTVYVDAIQVEQKSYVTTYCDGDQQGCSWLGPEHASTSERDVLEYSGGRERDLLDDFDFIVEGEDGTGMPAHKVNTNNNPVGYGSIINTVNVQQREFTITGGFEENVCTTNAAYLAARAKLMRAVNPIYGAVGDPSPVRLLNDRSGTKTYIDAYYQGGLDYAGTGGSLREDTIQIRFVADDPLFYALNNSAVALDAGGTFTAIGVLYKDDEAAWGDFNTPASSGTIYEIDVNDNGDILIVGDFTNFDSDAALDYFARYDASQDDYDTVFGTNPNNIVRTIQLVTKNGDAFWIGGDFTSVDGTTTEGIAYWSGSSVTGYTSTPISLVQDIAITPDGTVYACGEKSADTDSAVWRLSGGTWSSIGDTAPNEDTNFLVSDGVGNLYVAGNFTEVGGVSATNVAKYNGSAWEALGTGVGGGSDSLAVYISPSGVLYAYGAVAAGDYIFYWTGAQWNVLGGGVNNIVRDIIEVNGELHVVGDFTEVGSDLENPLTVEYYGIWTGTEWRRPDISGTNSLIRIAANNTGGLAIAILSGSSTAAYAGYTTQTYTGSALTFPVFVIQRSGGTSAELVSIANSLTGQVSEISKTIADGEKIKFDTKTNFIDSNAAFVSGSINDALGEIVLIPSRTTSGLTNQFSVFIDRAGSPTLTGYMLYRNAYLGVED